MKSLKVGEMSPLQNSIGWLEIHVADLARAQKFYESVFGRMLTPLPAGEPSIQLLMPVKKSPVQFTGTSWRAINCCIGLRKISRAPEVAPIEAPSV